MTVVEFFDGVSINNMVSCLAIKPDKIIFIGKSEMMKDQEEVYRRFIAKHKMQVAFEFKSANIYNLEELVDKLTAIVEAEDECTFDLTGGDDIILVAMGIVYERYRGTKKVQMHRFNVNSGSSTDVDKDGIAPPSKAPNLTVEENIAIYGGAIVPYDGNKGTYKWEIDNEFEADVRTLWEICKKDPTLWNAKSIAMATIAKLKDENQPKTFANADAAKVKRVFSTDKIKLSQFKEFLFCLEKKKLIKQLSFNNGGISFYFKNEKVKRCLIKAGNVLELIVSFSAQNATDKKGKKVYNDIVVGAFIDWDATLHEKKDKIKDTSNEIDLILMKGMVPVFVSCKNGTVEEEELYKLNTVAQKFGGPYARRLLVLTTGGNQSESGYEHLIQRAKDMGIKVLEGVHNFSNKEFEKNMHTILCK